MDANDSPPQIKLQNTNIIVTSFNILDSDTASHTTVFFFFLCLILCSYTMLHHHSMVPHQFPTFHHGFLGGVKTWSAKGWSTPETPSSQHIQTLYLWKRQLATALFVEVDIGWHLSYKASLWRHFITQLDALQGQYLSHLCQIQTLYPVSHFLLLVSPFLIEHVYTYLVSMISLSFVKSQLTSELFLSFPFLTVTLLLVSIYHLVI